jgi:hypothetical protein
MPGKAKPIEKTVTSKIAAVKTSRRKVVVEEEISELQKIVNRVADVRLDEIENNMLESELIEEGERHERGTEIYRLFKMWRAQMTDIGLPDVNYQKLKDLILEVFDSNEFNYWLMGEERYLQKILWSVLKQDGFCEEYKIRRNKTLGLMSEDHRWAYVITTFGSKTTMYRD